MTKDTRAILALGVLAWVFATMAIFPRYLEIEFALFQQTYLRIGVAFLLSFLVLICYIDKSKIKLVSRRDLLVIGFRAITLYLGVVLMTEAILHTKIANASFVAALPLLPIFGYFFFKESLRIKTIAYIFLGFVGVLLIAITDMVAFRFGYGELMALLSIIAFDLSYVARRWHTDTLNNLETACIMFGIGTLFLFITSLLFNEGLPSQGQFTFFTVSILLLAGFFNVANLYLTNYGFRHAKMAVAGNILTLETIFALVYGFMLFQEVPVGREIVGSILVLWSVYQVNKLESE
jgi:drug/metabolite transporter (DMT)-like permease